MHIIMVAYGRQLRLLKRKATMETANAVETKCPNCGGYDFLVHISGIITYKVDVSQRVWEVDDFDSDGVSEIWTCVKCGAEQSR